MAHEAKRTQLYFQVPASSCNKFNFTAAWLYKVTFDGNTSQAYSKKAVNADYTNSRTTLQRQFSGHILAFKKARYTLRVAGGRLIFYGLGPRKKTLHKICNKFFIDINEVWKKPSNLKSFIEKFKNRRKMFQYKR